MTRYVLTRLGQAAVVLWAAFTISFVILFLLPSDPVSMAADSSGQGVAVDQAALDQLRARYGLDQSVWVQYWTSLTNALRGDFGTSISTGQSVTDAIFSALPSTLVLGNHRFGSGRVVRSGDRVLRYLHPQAVAREPVVLAAAAGCGSAHFLGGLILLQLFSFRLHIFPAFGDKGFATVILPAITLAIPTGAVIAQVLTTSLQSTLRSPHVETAYAKGASRWRVQTRHALRLASIPAFTIAGVLVGTLLAGSVVVETVFSRAGVGRLTQTSVMAQDIPVVQGVVVFASLVFVARQPRGRPLLPLDRSTDHPDEEESHRKVEYRKLDRSGAGSCLTH